VPQNALQCYKAMMFLNGGGNSGGDHIPKWIPIVFEVMRVVESADRSIMSNLKSLPSRW
jgi:hypothetical protein